MRCVVIINSVSVTIQLEFQCAASVICRVREGAESYYRQHGDDSTKKSASDTNQKGESTER